MAVIERYIDYDRLAWFYDRYWGREYPARALGVLEPLLLARLPRAASVLDLCCGTGHLTRALAERGFRMTGMDGSAEMLNYARAHVPGAEFVPADARSFHWPHKFDAVVSTFESLNHILRLPELEIVFENVHAVLAEGGIFVFDMLMQEAYEKEWGKSSAIVERDNVCIVRGGYDAATRTGKTDITMFRLEETWQRSDVQVSQHCYDLGEIWSALDQAGFAEISSYDAHRSLEMIGPLAVGRMFFKAKKDRTE